MDHLINEIYNRQENLCGNYTKNSAIVVGLGGVGSWVALDLGLLGVGTLILIDPDKIEASNLNRTLFKLSDIGRFKTDAVKELISERRLDSIIITINEYFTLEHFEKYEVDYIFDCTDSLNVRSLLKDKATHYVKCGYDGLSATLCFNNFESGSWGEEGSYTIVPSFFGTPQIISALAVIEMVVEGSERKESITFEVNEIIDHLNIKDEENNDEEQQ